MANTFYMDPKEDWELVFDNEEHEPEYRAKDGSLWTHTSGQEDDECSVCNADLSDCADFFWNQDYAVWRLLCRKCAGFLH